MFDKMIEAAKSVNWQVSNLGELGFAVPEGITELEFEKHSPAGEDFSFVAIGSTPEDIIDEIKETADGFDPEAHANSWYNNRDSVSGVPQSLRVLLEDADAIKAMLNELFEVVSTK